MLITKLNKIDNFLDGMNSRKILLILLIFILLRLVFLFFYNGNFNSVEDYRIAINLAQNNSYSLEYSVGATAIKVPVYPLFLSLFIKLFGSNAKFWIVLFQHIFIGLVPLMIYKLGIKTNLKKEFAIASLLFLIHPSYFYYPMVIEVTNIFIPLTLIWLLFYFDFKNSILSGINSAKYAIILGFFSGILVLTQPIIAPVLFIFILYLLFKFYKTSFAKFAILFIIFLVVLSPWIIRNYYTFDKFIPTKSPFWMNLYEGFMPDNHLNKNFNLISNSTQNTIDSLKNVINDVEMEKFYKPIVIETISNHPDLYLQKTFYQMFIYWWIPPRYFDNNSKQFLIVRKLPVIILSILFIIGLVQLFKRNKLSATAILFTLGYFTIFYGLTMVANIRFKLDIEWIELIAISSIFTSILRKYNK